MCTEKPSEQWQPWVLYTLILFHQRDQSSLWEGAGSRASRKHEEDGEELIKNIRKFFKKRKDVKNDIGKSEKEFPTAGAGTI